jgi:hypothetical protein
MRLERHARNLPLHRTVYFVFDGSNWKLDRYERWLGWGFLDTFLEPWRNRVFPSSGKALEFVEGLIEKEQLV